MVQFKLLNVLEAAIRVMINGSHVEHSHRRSYKVEVGGRYSRSYERNRNLPAEGVKGVLTICINKQIDQLESISPFCHRAQHRSGYLTINSKSPLKPRAYDQRNLHFGDT